MVSHLKWPFRAGAYVAGGSRQPLADRSSRLFPGQRASGHDGRVTEEEAQLVAAVAAQRVTWGKERAPVMRHGRLFTPGTDAGGGEFPMIPAYACKNGYRKAVASGLLYAEGWVLRPPRRILVHAGWCLDGQAVVDPGFTEPAAAYFGVALDPDYMRRVQESDHDDDGNDIFMGVFHPYRERYGPPLDPISDIAGSLGRDIPASVRDWALTSEPRRVREEGAPAWVLEELRRFSDTVAR